MVSRFGPMFASEVRQRGVNYMRAFGTRAGTLMRRS